MKLGLILAVLWALLCISQCILAEPNLQSKLETIPAVTKINPKFLVNVERSDQRNYAPSGAEEDDLTAEEEAELAEDEEEENNIREDEGIETYYPVSDDNGQTYLIPESVLEVMAEKQEAHDDSATYLVPNGSVRLDSDDDSEDEDNSAIILSEGSIDDDSLVDGGQYIAIVQEPDNYGKARRPIRRGIANQRRQGGQRLRRRRGGSRAGLRKRRTRKRIRRGGRRGGRRGNRRGGGGRMTLGRVRLRRTRGYGSRF